MKNEKKPAFPFVNQEGGSLEDREVHYGVSKREYFAGLAMQSFILNKSLSTWDACMNNEGVTTDVAAASLNMADELLKQLEVNH